MTNEQREIRRQKRILEYAEEIGNIRKAYRYCGIPDRPSTSGEIDTENSGAND